MDRERERKDIDDIIRDYDRGAKEHKGIEHRHDGVLPIPSILGGATVMLGTSVITVGSGPMENLKILLAGASVTVVSLFVNKALFHYGSRLAATGNPWVIGLAVGWFATMFGVLGTVSFTGMSYGIVEGKNLRKPVAAIEQLSRDAKESVIAAQGVGPLVASAAADKANIAACEASSGCVSGRAGRGPLVGALDGLAQKSRGVERLYADAEKKVTRLARELEKVAADYERQLSAGGVLGASRADLLAIYSRGQAIATELRGAVPTEAARALANELRRVQVAPAKPARIDVSARLRAHADQIDSAIRGIETSDMALPPFPGPSGIASGWEHIEETWPLVVLLFGLETVLVVLWVLLVLDIRTRVEVRRRQKDNEDVDDDDPEGPALAPAAPQPTAAVAGRRRSQLIGRANGVDQ